MGGGGGARHALLTPLLTEGSVSPDYSRASDG